MLRSKKIAVTGGLSAGKTTVCEFLKAHGAYVVSADAIAHQLLIPETPLGNQILALFSERFREGIVRDGTFDRKALGEIVFQDEKALSQLEEILHPAVYAEIEEKYKQHSKNHPLFVAEIPLLFETHAEDFFDVVVTVIAPHEDCKKRLSEKGLSPKEYNLRMKRQWPPEQKAAKSHFVINNSKDLPFLKSQVDQLFHTLTHSITH